MSVEARCGSRDRVADAALQHIFSDVWSTIAGTTPSAAPSVRSCAAASSAAIVAPKRIRFANQSAHLMRAVWV